MLLLKKKYNSRQQLYRQVRKDDIILILRMRSLNNWITQSNWIQLIPISLMMSFLPETESLTCLALTNKNTEQEVLRQKFWDWFNDSITSLGTFISFLSCSSAILMCCIFILLFITSWPQTSSSRSRHHTLNVLRRGSSKQKIWYKIIFVFQCPVLVSTDFTGSN